MANRKPRGRLPADRNQQVWIVRSANHGWCRHYHSSRAMAEKCLFAMHRKETRAHRVRAVGDIDRHARCILTFRAEKARDPASLEEAISDCWESAQKWEDLTRAADAARAAACLHGHDPQLAFEANELRSAAVAAWQGHRVSFSQLQKSAPRFWPPPRP